MSKGVDRTSYVPGLISIIIPVYNIEKYLDKCMESVVGQTYSHIEIILVDDGSTDGSGKLCDEWGKKDNRVKVYHKKNGGAARARNLGLKEARGEYIGFVDGDDYIAEDMYACLIDAMEEEVDLVCCSTEIVFPAKMRKPVEAYGQVKSPVCFSNQEAIRELLLVQKLSFSSCDKLYRRELFYGVRFPEGKTCEDYPVSYEVVKKSRRVVNIGKVKYFYRYREGSTSKQQFNLRKMSYVLFTRDILRDVIEYYPEEKKCAEALYIRSIVDTMRSISRSTKREEYEELSKRLRKLLQRMCVSILMNKHIPDITKKNVIKIICKIEI